MEASFLIFFSERRACFEIPGHRVMISLIALRGNGTERCCSVSRAAVEFRRFRGLNGPSSKPMRHERESTVRGSGCARRQRRRQPPRPLLHNHLIGPTAQPAYQGFAQNGIRKFRFLVPQHPTAASCPAEIRDAPHAVRG